MLEPYVAPLAVIAETEMPAAPKRSRMSNRQLDFLRNLRKHACSLPLMTWPRATTLRKWMRRPRFRAAVEGLEQAFAVEARLLMAGAATQAAVHIQSILAGGSREYATGNMTPREIECYIRPMKQCLGVLWAEMARRDQSQRVGVQAEILRRIGGPQATPDDVEVTPEYVI